MECVSKVSNMTNLLELPLDIVQEILCNLPGYQLARLSTTSWTIYQLIHEDRAWRNRVRMELTRFPNLVIGENYYQYYKRIYSGSKKTLDVLSLHFPTYRKHQDMCNSYKFYILNLPNRCICYGDYIRDTAITYTDSARKLYRKKEFLRTAAELGLDVWGEKIMSEIASIQPQSFQLTCSKHSNPFYIAIANNQLHFTDILLQYSWSVYFSPWSYGQDGSCDQLLVNGLLKCGSQGIKHLHTYLKNVSLSPIHHAALQGRLNELLNILDQVRLRNRRSFPSILFMAVVGDQIDCVRLLVKNGWTPKAIKNKKIQLLSNELVLAIIADNLPCFRVMLEESCPRVSLVYIRQSIFYALCHGCTEFIEYLLNRDYQSIIQEEIYLLARRVISHKNVKIAHILRVAGPLSRHVILRLVPLLPYCCTSQSSYSDFYDYKVAVSMIAMLRCQDRTTQEIAYQTQFYQLIKLVKEVIEDSNNLTNTGYGLILNVLIIRRKTIQLTDQAIQKRYEETCAELIRLLIELGGEKIVCYRNRAGHRLDDMILDSGKKCWIELLPSTDSP